MTADLQQSIDAFLKTANDAGLAYYNAGEWDSAVEAYKAAGNAGAENLGPAIDERTSGVSAPLTQQAWQVNADLNKINSGPFNGTAATKADADQAVADVKKMWELYQAAYTAVTTTPQKPGTWTPQKAVAAVQAKNATTATPAAGSSVMPLLGGALIGGAALAVAIGGVPAIVGGAIAGTIVGALLGKKSGG